MPQSSSRRNTQTPQLIYTVGAHQCEDAAYGGAKACSAMEEPVRAGDLPNFGVLLRRYRLAAGLSQEALADRARMSANGIGSLERGDRRTPQRETLSLLAGALALDERQREEFEASAARSALPRRLGGDSPVGPWAAAVISNLPIALTSFVGRDKELAEIAALVGDHRMVTLTGAGGVGKTQTALHVAAELDHTGDHVVCFVALAAIADPSLVVATAASALGVQQVPNRPLLESVASYLKNRSLLLILDNCEHVIAQAAAVADALLTDCARVRVLATSREPLRAAGEYAYRLPSLGLPSAEAALDMSAAEARSFGVIVLFSDRASASNHRFALVDENASVVAGICRRLDGIPLAVELAAARVNLLSVKEIAEKLDDRFRLLTGGARTALPRQQTMRATIDWSYDLLAASEQRVFDRLSVFANGCTLTAASAICVSEEIAENDVLDLLSSLVDKSLVVADFEGSQPRYRLLESFREYAREQLLKGGAREVFAHRHALAYLELAETMDRVFLYEPDDVLQAQAHEELDNWRAALQWTLTDRRDVALAQRLVGELCALWQQVAPTEGRRWLASTLELVDERTPMSILARLSYTDATIAMTLGEPEAALAASRTAITRYRVLADALGIALAEGREATALLSLDRDAEAKAVLEEALGLARSVANGWVAAWILRLFGIVASDEGDLVGARRYVEEALRYHESVGGKIDIAWAKKQLSGIEFDAGNMELALRYASGALAAFRTLNHSRGTADALLGVAFCLLSLTRYGEAETMGREALDVAREHRLDNVVDAALECLAIIPVLRPQGAERNRAAYTQAARILGFVDARSRARGARLKDERTLRGLGALREALGTDAVAELMSEGAALTEEQALDEASV